MIINPKKYTTIGKRASDMVKNFQIANFNVTFGNEAIPMLDFFDTVIYPAFKSKNIRIINDNSYLFLNIEIHEYSPYSHVLTGVLVRKTTLEIKSDLTSDGNLIEKDEQYSTAPYSLFAINLRNHRMVFMPNQKGSPSLASFQSTAKHVINSYIKTENQKRCNDNKLEYAEIHVVGIPNAETIDNLLDNVKKIKRLTLRFYPLNGDIDYSEAFDILTNQMRKTLGCKTGEVVFNNPKSITGAKKIIAQAGGTISPILKVTTNENSEATFKDDTMSERYALEVVDDSDITNTKQQLLDKMTEIETVNYTNSQHNDIYNRNKAKIIPFVRQEDD